MAPWYRIAGFGTFGLANYALAWRLLLANRPFAAVVLSALLLALAGCLARLAFTDPGRVPQLYCGTSQGQARFCLLCSNIKPPRCHHCRVCRKCVLKMDHHCFWVDRCIGFANYKSYFLTLLYAALASLAMLVLLWRNAFSSSGGGGGGGGSGGSLGAKAGWWGSALLAVDAMLLALLLCGVTYLLCWHCYLVSKNATTIEYYQIQRSRRDPSCPHKVLSHEHDLGLLQNLRAVLGSNAALWFVPTIPDDSGSDDGSGSVAAEHDLSAAREARERGGGGGGRNDEEIGMMPDGDEDLELIARSTNTS